MTLIPLSALLSVLLSAAVPSETMILKQIPSELISASASSCFQSNPAHLAVDGSGMTGERHVSNNGGEMMWLSDETSAPEQVWFQCSFNSPQRVDQIRIWNHNQNEHTRRGLNKVTIEYSVDGSKWTLIKCGSLDYHLIPESIGRNPEEADYVIDLPGRVIRYLRITADAYQGNHYDLSDPLIALETSDLNQNPHYYGLSEIRFYSLKKTALNSLERLDKISFQPTQGYLRTDKGPAREYSLTFNAPLYMGGILSFEMDSHKWSEKIPASPRGISSFNGLLPEGFMDEDTRISICLDSPQANLNGEFPVPAARKWTVSFLPHSHQDIGYTHRQKDVMKLQWRNLERAMDLADRTAQYPYGAQFKWNSEATWAVIGYLEEYAGTAKAERLIEAIRKGTINIDASLGSILSGISRQEELMHYFDDAHRIREITGITPATAMMSDVPGHAWGLATALSENGIRYFSSAPNYVPMYGRIGNDRAAILHVRWGDRPFWWQSQSGQDKVLVWEAGRGYSCFHGWLAGRLSVCGLDPIWQYLGELEAEEFPYDVCYLRYTVHGDNGPPDEKMPDIIKAWNEKYASPEFLISTSTEFFEAFEERYSEAIPSYGGDMTPTWEDGAASTARQTSSNRNSAAKLAQSEILWSMLRSFKDFPRDSFRKGWKNVILFSEHTWGSAASGPDPDSEFTRVLWKGKKTYADSAAIYADEAMRGALGTIEGKGNFIQVLNTNIWERTDLVTLPWSDDLAGKALLSQSGEMVPLQRISEGEAAFVAQNVPAMSSAVYEIVSSVKTALPFAAGFEDNCLDNGLVRVQIDPQTGAICSMKVAGDDFEYAAGALNDYQYSERVAQNPQGAGAVKSIELVCAGPVLSTVRITSEAPGCNVLYRDISLFAGSDKVLIVNTLDKKDIRDFENVRFIFPFNFPHPEIAMDLAMSEVHPEREQLSGVNKHYYSLQNGLAVGDLEHAVCMTCIDAPFVEFGSPSGEDYRLNPRYGYGWWSSAQLSPTVYSWVMNNTWRTNYKASQGGVCAFRYSLQACNPFITGLKKKGLEEEQKLLAVRSSNAEAVTPLFTLRGHNELSISSLRPSKDGRGYIVCLQNLNNQSAHTGFIWGSIKADRAFKCNFLEQRTGDLDPDSFWLKPYEYLIIKLTIE